MTMSAMSGLRHVARASVVCAACLPLTACLEEATTNLPYLAVNHTNRWVASFLVNGEGGVLNVPPQGGGGGTACCVVLPKRWRPDLTVTVTWRVEGTWLKDAQGKDVIENGQQVLVEAPWQAITVPVPEYTDKDLGHFGVHFLPNNQAQVKVSFIYPWHRDYRPAYPAQRRTPS